MKKLIAMLLCLLLVLGLCACGNQQQPENNNVPENNAPVSGDPAGEPEKEPAQNQEDPEEEPSGEQEESPVEIAKSYIDKPLSELIAVIGEPESSDYAPSCLGDGEDGLLVYDGFVVYTYREGETETVYDVE